MINLRTRGSLQVECQSVEEAIEAAGAGADIVMLDNFTHETIHEAAKSVKAVHANVLVEASGVSDR
jgi:nicotinate-nucleotide pyrophosphorylase (carboxylating)